MITSIPSQCPLHIVILGTGEFARGLTERLTDIGTTVTIGGRNPGKILQLPEKDIFRRVKVTDIADAVQESDLIVVAIHAAHHVTLSPFADSMAGKVVVDISNSLKGDSTSNAQKLAMILPHSHIVKAFNTVSAYTLSTYVGSSRSIYVCGDNANARACVIQLAGRLGFSGIDNGFLIASRNLEAANRLLLPGWGWPTIVMFIVSVVWVTYTMVKYYYMRDTPYTWDRLPTNVTNKMFGVISITLLACVYIPGSIAAFIQLTNGSKQKRLSKGLIRWLKMRKQLGLYALLFGTLHTFFSITILSPAYFSSWFHTSSVEVPHDATVPTEVDIDSRMNWIGETNVLLGMLAIFTMALLGMTSIPSIANSLNWREWQFLQSYMGFVCLLFTAGHVTVKGASSWVHETYDEILPSMAFISLVLPWFALGMRIILFLPCVHIRLQRIRLGWQNRDPASQSYDVQHKGGAHNNGYDGSASDMYNSTTETDQATIL